MENLITTGTQTTTTTTFVATGDTFQGPKMRFKNVPNVYYNYDVPYRLSACVYRCHSSYRFPPARPCTHPVDESAGRLSSAMQVGGKWNSRTCRLDGNTTTEWLTTSLAYECARAHWGMTTGINHTELRHYDVGPWRRYKNTCHGDGLQRRRQRRVTHWPAKRSLTVCQTLEFGNIGLRGLV